MGTPCCVLEEWLARMVARVTVVDLLLLMLMASMFSSVMSALGTSAALRGNMECTEMWHSSKHGLTPMLVKMEGLRSALHKLSKTEWHYIKIVISLKHLILK